MRYFILVNIELAVSEFKDFLFKSVSFPKWVFFGHMDFIADNGITFLILLTHSFKQGFLTTTAFVGYYTVGIVV